jgi:hypothetical protein
MCLSRKQNYTECNSVKAELNLYKRSTTLLCTRVEGVQKFAEHRPALLFDLDA